MPHGTASTVLTGGMSWVFLAVSMVFAVLVVNAYFPIYAVVALLVLVSLMGLICLPAIQRREGPVAHKAAEPDSMPLLT